jgi:hypothetical protein
MLDMIHRSISGLARWWGLGRRPEGARPPQESPFSGSLWRLRRHNEPEKKDFEGHLEGARPLQTSYWGDDRISLVKLGSKRF